MSVTVRLIVRAEATTNTSEVVPDFLVSKILLVGVLVAVVSPERWGRTIEVLSQAVCSLCAL